MCFQNWFYASFKPPFLCFGITVIPKAPGWMSLHNSTTRRIVMNKTLSMLCIIVLNLIICSLGCNLQEKIEKPPFHPMESHVTYSYEEPPASDPLPQSDPTDVGGLDGKFKVPVPKGYNWEVTQSWGEHCQKCIDKGYTDWKYCTDPESLAHVTDCCKYSWDFSLPGAADDGLPVLASGSGVIKKIADSGDVGWGVHVVVDHGNDVCTLYAHMKEGSTSHLKPAQAVCQGLVLGGIGETGHAIGKHLHFQFQKCSTSEPIKMGFTDGNGVPECTRNKDIYDAKGNYAFLKLTTDAVNDCSAGVPTPPSGGWSKAACGSLKGCPLNNECSAPSNYKFADHYKLSTSMADAAAYLYSECAIDGFAQNMLLPEALITRAEALKVAMYLFNLMGDCGQSDSYTDVDYNKWYFPIVACATKKGVLDNWGGYFGGDEPASFEQVAKYLVRAGVVSGTVQMTLSKTSHFKYIPVDHPAHVFAETVFSHGGSESNFYYFLPDGKISRGQFISMAASLSPCYCKNVSCGDGCSCNQEKFSCGGVSASDGANAGADAGSSGADGGGFSDGDADAGSSGNADGGGSSNGGADAGGGSVAGPKYLIDCFLDTKKPVLCDGDKNVFRVACHMENKTNTPLEFENLDLAIINDNGGKCVAIDFDLNDGYTQTVNGNVYKKLAGDYSIACLSPPTGGEVSISFNLMVEINGVEDWKYGVLNTTIEIASKDFKQCMPTGCVTQCKGKNCGDDGCGGVCGQCMPGKEVCIKSVCQKPICTPSCEGKECGSDGCDGMCPSCADGFWCSSYKCLPVPCTPQCYQKMCGPDECGGSCGQCNNDQLCTDDGQCKKKPLCVCVPD